jgi:acyl-CoA thioester hydrolase
MNEYSKTIDIRWSDLDPNFHVRHSAYYDFGAYVRICFLTDFGLTTEKLLQHNLGPILFREECVFKREIQFGDGVTINIRLKKCNATVSRWTIIHEIKKDDNILCAIITVDGAWLDTLKRKLTVPPQFVVETFDKIERTEDFELLQGKARKD